MPKSYYLRYSAMLLAIFAFQAQADASHDKWVTIHTIDSQGIGQEIGKVQLQDSANGLVISPNIQGLSPGTHGFHIHEKPNCGSAEKEGKMVAGLAAGGHFDPHSSAKHDGPDGHGHHGDLPALMVAEDGTATQKVIAPRISIADITNRSLMIHEGGDNYSDKPKPLGGGGARIACGVID